MDADARHGLGRRRRAVGLTQEALAAQLRVDRVSVSRWERHLAQPQPQPHVRAGLAAALQISAADLDRLLSAPASPSPATGTVADDPTIAADRRDQGDDDMFRRDFLRQVAVTAAAIATPGTDSSRDPRDIAGHEAIEAHLWRSYALAPSKQALSPSVVDYLDGLHASLQQSHTTGSRQRLCTLAGSAYQLAGEILYDRGHHADAASCYVLAADASKEAAHYDLWACALTRHGLVHLAQDSPSHAATLLSAAQRVAAQGDPALSTRHWVAAVQAEAFAKTGDAAACLRALETADDVHDTNTTHNGGWLRFDGTRTAELHGACLVDLGDYTRADEALSLAARTSLTSRRSASVHTDLATVALHTADHDRLAYHAATVVDLARAHTSGYIMNKVDTLRRRVLRDNTLPPHHRIIRQLDTAAER